MNDVIDPMAYIRGRVDGYLVHPGSVFGFNGAQSERTRVFNSDLPGIWEHMCTHHNDMLYEWGAIIQNLLRGSPDGKAYNIGGMYIEFDNSGATVSPPPSVARSDSLNYYNDLNSNDANQDYLRIPLVATEEATSDAVLYPKNNIARFIAQTAGTIGVHGNTYSDGSNSRVYGGALVAFLDETDAAQDILLSRFYFAEANQVLKPAGSQVGITWSETFI